jgi:predicted kinase
VLVCDVDVLRTMVAGWQDDPDAAERVRSAALALVTAYLRTGHDVVLPQLLARSDQVDRFRTAAEEADALMVTVLLVLEPDEAVARFRARATSADEAWTSYATAAWDGRGGDRAVRDVCARLEALAREDRAWVRVPSTDLEATYRGVLEALAASESG